MKADSKHSGSVVTASGPSALETFTMTGASDLSSSGSMAWVTADGAEHVDLVDREHVVRGRLRHWYPPPGTPAMFTSTSRRPACCARAWPRAATQPAVCRPSPLLAPVI